MHRPNGRNSIPSLDYHRFRYDRRNDGCAYQPYCFWYSFRLTLSRRLADHRSKPNHSDAIRIRERSRQTAAWGLRDAPCRYSELREPWLEREFSDQRQRPKTGTYPPTETAPRKPSVRKPRQRRAFPISLYTMTKQQTGWWRTQSDANESPMAITGNFLQIAGQNRLLIGS